MPPAAPCPKAAPCSSPNPPLTSKDGTTARAQGVPRELQRAPQQHCLIHPPSPYMRRSLSGRTHRWALALLEHLSVRRLDHDVFVGESVDLGWGRVYGGQTMAQAVRAAHMSAPADRVVRSFSAWFARAGQVEKGIEYRVSRLNDGGSISTRLVEGAQEAQTIFTMTACLTADAKSSFEHRRPLFAPPQPFEPHTRPTMQQQLAPAAAKFIKNARLRSTYIDPDSPFDFRPIDFVPPWEVTQREPDFAYYVKFRQPLAAEDCRGHVELLAYLSDWTFLATALRPHPMPSAAVQMATLSHHLFIHGAASTLRVDDFLYFRCAAPAASHGRATVIGEYFDKSGVLVASAVQDGVMRPFEPGRS